MSDTYAPIPNERQLIAALRAQWHAVGGTAAYRKGILTTITIVNGRAQRRIRVEPAATGTFDEDAVT